jgi:hypothetical protein
MIWRSEMMANERLQPTAVGRDQPAAPETRALGLQADEQPSDKNINNRSNDIEY